MYQSVSRTEMWYEVAIRAILDQWKIEMSDSLKNRSKESTLHDE